MFDFLKTSITFKHVLQENIFGVYFCSQKITAVWPWGVGFGYWASCNNQPRGRWFAGKNCKTFVGFEVADVTGAKGVASMGTRSRLTRRPRQSTWCDAARCCDARRRDAVLCRSLCVTPPASTWPGTCRCGGQLRERTLGPCSLRRPTEIIKDKSHFN